MSTSVAKTIEPSDKVVESPDYVRVSSAAAMTLGLMPGRFLRGAKLYCINLLLMYDSGCAGKCAYCGLERARQSDKSWEDRSFIRVPWPVVSLDEVIERMGHDYCSHVQRVCVSMVTNGRAKGDTLEIVRRLSKKTDSISGLIAPTIIDKNWLIDLKEAGADWLGVAVDAATPELFDQLRGKGVGGPHRWDRYWKTVEQGVEVFGKYKVGIHLIVGVGETEQEFLSTVQKAYDMGSLTHLFSFFPEAGSAMTDCTQPPVGQYRRSQLARYLINKGLGRFEDMSFDENGKLTDFGVPKSLLDETIDSGVPFMTSGCDGKTRTNVCNRPFSNCTPYQAYMGELRNYPFTPIADDIVVIRKQLEDYSDIPTKEWKEGLGCG